MKGIDSLSELAGVGPKRLATLANLGIHCAEDLLLLKPNRYEDRSQITPIAEAPVGEQATLRGTITSVRVIKGRNWKKRLQVTIDDGSAQLTGVWFNQSYLKEQFTRGRSALFSGKVGNHKGLQIQSPAFEIEEEDQPHSRCATVGRTVAIYPLCGGLGQNLLRSLADQALVKYASAIPTIIEGELYPYPGFSSRLEALKSLHFPKNIDSAERARRYLAYEEFFLFQIALQRKRHQLQHGQAGRSFRISTEIDQRIRTLFPFAFTAAQDRALREISSDLCNSDPMNRLVQGDVGSGKTAVALYAMLSAVANRCQACIMAPTEILARQHEKTICELLQKSNVRIISLVGSLSATEKRAAHEKIAAGEADIIIGTHALVQEKVAFKDLGLAVIDEQHKFGVAQRSRLLQKGRQAKLLLMSATPIPRSMAMTIYGDLDISVIDELPPGRKPVTTKQIQQRSRHKALEFMRGKIASGQQAYCVYPLVDESEKLDLKSATEMAELFASEIFPEFSVALLHGKLDAAQKNRIMLAFAAGEIDILVSTVVIEVGVNVPNANIMLIEEAQRFGLAQIHQLRGRIGRGDQEAHCLLMAGEGSQATRQRLAVLVDTDDGFKISEADLQIRGPGEFMGTKQHGLPAFSYGDVMDDFALMEEARNRASNLLDKEKELTRYPAVKEASRRYDDVLIGG